MNCYQCEKSIQSGETRYGIRVAVGVCHFCGIGVCLEHSFRPQRPGAPLLCLECAQLNEAGVSKLVDIATSVS